MPAEACLNQADGDVEGPLAHLFPQSHIPLPSQYENVFSESGGSLAQSIVKSQTPEEREYARYLGEIEMRKRRVAELQTELELLKEDLGRFDAEYHVRVGTLFVELDTIQLSISEYEFRIARLLADLDIPNDELEQETRSRFSDQRDEIHHDEEKTRRYQHAFHEDRQRPKLDDATETALKSLYRELAKRFHPDLARTELERQQLEVVMKRINAAFHERDVNSLQSLKNEAEIEDASFESRSIGEKLVWAIREMSRLDDLIVTITSEIATLQTSDLASLWQRHQAGEGVLEQLERDLNRRIDNRCQTLQQLVGEFQELTGRASDE